MDALHAAFSLDHPEIAPDGCVGDLEALGQLGYGDTLFLFDEARDQLSTLTGRLHCQHSIDDFLALISQASWWIWSEPAHLHLEVSKGALESRLVDSRHR